MRKCRGRRSYRRDVPLLQLGAHKAPDELECRLGDGRRTGYHDEQSRNDEILTNGDCCVGSCHNRLTRVLLGSATRQSLAVSDVLMSSACGRL